MFTGLVQDIGTLLSIRRGPMTVLSIEGFMGESMELGESVAVNGTCLSVVRAQPGSFDVEASPHTVRATAIDCWLPGRKLHLERALRLSDRLGGHIVQGHVDAAGKLLSRRFEGGSLVLSISLPEGIARFVIPRASIAVDGVSLTVSALDSASGAFEVTLIPDTQKRTALASLHPGEQVNLEADVIGKYVASLLSKEGRGPGGVSEELLRRAGFS